MFQHGPSCMSGPITRERGWWMAENEEPAGRASATLAEAPEGSTREDQPIRTELVERVRREIAAGTYDTPEKWEKALDRLQERLNRAAD